MTIEDIADLAGVFAAESAKLHEEAQEYRIGSSDRHAIEDMSASVGRLGLRIWEIADKRGLSG